jgi:hypothetical protein
MMVPARMGWRADMPKLPGEAPDWEAGPLLRTAPPPPTVASCRNLVVSILDQGGLSSCVANAIVQAIRASHVAQGVAKPRLASRLLAYYISRAIHNETGEDSGTYLRTCFQGLSKFGFCPEETWPYDQSKFSRMPTHAAFRGAADQASPPPLEYVRITSAGSQRLVDIKRAIALGHLVCFGTLVSERFAYGDLPSEALKPPVSGEPIAGGHALCIGEYDGDTFGIVNSWGVDWGERGWCRFRGDYLAWSQTTDLWIVARPPLYSE